MDQADLTLTTLTSDPFYAIFHKRFHALESSFTWAELLGQPLVFYQRRRAPRLFDRLIEISQPLQLTSNIAAEAESFFAAFAMAQAGLGIALLPKPLLRLQHDLVVLPLPQNASLLLETACGVHSSRRHDKLILTATNHIITA